MMVTVLDGTNYFYHLTCVIEVWHPDEKYDYDSAFSTDLLNILEVDMVNDSGLWWWHVIFI